MRAQIRSGENAFPERTSSMIERQLSSNTSSKAEAIAVEGPKDVHHDFAVPTTQTVDRRTFSSQSQPLESVQPFSMQRAYPGHRVLSSPALEWKTATSIAHVAGLASGYFAQYDGMLIIAPRSIIRLLASQVQTRSRLHQ